MHFDIQAFAEALIIAVTLSLDSFASGFAYGASKIKIPIKSALILSFICSVTLGITLLLGNLIRPYISADIIKYISFAILLAIGLFKLFEELIKLLLKRTSNRQIKFNVFNFHFILQIFGNETEADSNKDKILSAAEAVSLAVALSMDGLAVGFSAGLTGANPILLIAFSFAIGFSAVMSGHKVGDKIASKVKINLSWLSGLILAAIAVTKLF